MATSRYEAISDGHDEDNDSGSLPSRSHDVSPVPYEDRMLEDDRSRSVSPQGSVKNRLETTTPDSQSRSYEAPSVVTVQEDIPFHRTGTRASVVSSTTTLYPEDQLVFGTDAERKLSAGSHIKYSFSPSTHHPRYPNYERLGSIPDRNLEASPTARIYGYWRQTKRLWRLAAAEWLATAALCGAYAGLLVGYAAKLTISPNQIMVFNAVSTVLSFLLGVNLAGSMKSYAKMLRWLLLSLCWQPLETFDLVVGCDSLLNVFKLIWKSWFHKSRRLRFISMVLAICWLSLTMTLTLLVAMIGLSYSTVTSDDYLDTIPGLVQITDFGGIDTSDFSASASEIQQAGVRGWRAQCSTTGDFSPSEYCGTNGTGSGWYTLQAWNPNDSSLGIYSNYVVYAGANCTEHRITEGGTGDSYNITWLDEQTGLRDLNIARNEQNLPYGGGIVAISGWNSSWTDQRSTTMAMFFPRDKTDPVGGQGFTCDVWLGRVWQNYWVTDSWELAPGDYQIGNTTSYMLAAAMGWNGDTYITTGSGAEYQSATYKNYSEIAMSVPQMYGDGRLSTDNVADLVVSFAIKAILALDTRTTGINKFKDIQGDVPVTAQALSVDWPKAIGFLTAIPALQLVACIAVFAFANRAIIKDDSPLSIARLYWSLLEKYDLGKRGCMLKGSEMVEFISKKTGEKMGPMVTYGWKPSGARDAQGRTIGNLDVYEKSDEGMDNMTPAYSSTWQSGDTMHVKNNFWGGINYDGVGAVSATAQRERLRPGSHDSASSQ